MAQNNVNNQRIDNNVKSNTRNGSPFFRGQHWHLKNEHEEDGDTDKLLVSASVSKKKAIMKKEKHAVVGKIEAKQDRLIARNVVGASSEFRTKVQESKPNPRRRVSL